MPGLRLVGLGIGTTNRRDGKQSSFVVAIGVIFVYYIFMYTSEALAKARWIPAELAMWVPNIVLGLFGAVLVLWRTRFADVVRSLSIPLPWRRAAGTDAASPASPTPPRRSLQRGPGPARTWSSSSRCRTWACPVRASWTCT